MTDQCSPDIVARLRDLAELLSPENTDSEAGLHAICEEAAEEIDRLRAGNVAQSAWRPIETAPRDGTPMLGFMPKYFRGKGGQSVILWLDIEWSDMGAHPCAPSHWRPLPEAPALPSAERGGADV